MSETQIPTAEKYLKFRMNVMLNVLKEFFKNGDLAKINFLITIDFWDWEMECILEGTNTVNMFPKVTGVNRVIPVKLKTNELSALALKTELLNHWNALVIETHQLYGTLDEDDRDGLGLFDVIDFNLYLKR